MEPDVDHSVDPLLNVTLPPDGRTVPPVVTHISRRADALPVALPDAGYGASVRDEIEAGQVSANGVDFHLLSCGRGPLALCFHGFPDSAHTWRHLLPRLAQAGFRAVAPFQRGYGPTAVPPTACSKPAP